MQQNQFDQELGEFYSLRSLQTIKDSRGSLTVIERLPFEIKRVYYLHSIDHEATRGGHAHRALRRMMVAINGSFAITVSGKKPRHMVLDTPIVGMLIEPLEWVELHDFTPGAICLVLASLEHDEADCVRDLAEFKELTR